MGTGTIFFISSILLFLIVYFAVRIAIQPLINNPEEIIKEQYGWTSRRIVYQNNTAYIEYYTM